MRTFGFRGLTNAALLRKLAELFARDCAFTAELVACVGEVEARKLYREAGYPSMYKYCIGEYHLGEQAAYKRIQAARAARRFPVFLAMIADGRIHLSAVVLLRPHLTEATVDELLAAATHKTKREVERLLAQRFPRADVPARVVPLGPPTSSALPISDTRLELATTSAAQLSPGIVETCQSADDTAEATAPMSPGAPAAVEAPTPQSKAAERFAIQFTIDEGTYEKLQHVQQLLGHRVPYGDLAQVFDRALDALVTQLEKRKFAATEKPRPVSRESSDDPRHIPAHVKRAVRERDQGQCTFVSENGQRCTASEDLEYDHIEPVARGGRSTVDNLRLRCRAHNQYEAERAFGAEFIENKRHEARRARKEARAKAAAANLARAAGNPAPSRGAAWGP